MKQLVIFLIVVLLVCLGIVIGSQNDQLIAVNFLIAQASMRLSTLLAIVLAIGFTFGLLCLLTSWLSLRLQLSITKQKLKKLQSE